jgi:hypothetical protein
MKRIEARGFEIKRISNFNELPEKNGVKEHVIFIEIQRVKQSQAEKTAKRETVGNRNI